MFNCGYCGIKGVQLDADKALTIVIVMQHQQQLKRRQADKAAQASKAATCEVSQAYEADTAQAFKAGAAQPGPFQPKPGRWGGQCTQASTLGALTYSVTSTSTLLAPIITSKL